MFNETAQKNSESTVNDFIKDPLEVLNQAKTINHEIFISSCQQIEGVLMGQPYYKSLINRIKELEEKLCEAELVQRHLISASQPCRKVYTLEELKANLCGIDYNDEKDWE